MKRIRINVRGRWYTVEVKDVGRGPTEVKVNGEPYQVEVEDYSPVRDAAPQRSQAVADRSEPPGLRAITQNNETTVRCPMAGRIVAVSIQVGQRVEEGQEVCVLESMKMEQSVRLSRGGTVKKVPIQPGQTIQAGESLIELE